MIPIRKQHYIIDVSTSSETIIEKIQKNNSLDEIKRDTGVEHYYDTFDWRLYRKGFLLTIARNILSIRKFNGKEKFSAPGRNRKKLFHWDIEDGPLAHFLQKHIEMRALCPTVALRYQIRHFKVLNRDRKSVAWIDLTSSIATNGTAEMELPESLVVTSVRGYEKSFQKLIAQPALKSLKQVKGSVDLLERAYGISERQPLDYGAKFFVQMGVDISVGQAVSKICLNLVDSMHTNYHGVYNDIDSEFLHDFRIAVRRTRSLMSLLRKYLPHPGLAFFETEFKWLGSVTGPVRDIDVYLLKQEEYERLVPPRLRVGLRSFFDQLSERRKTELAELKKQLRSERYQQLHDKWKSFLTDPASELFSGAGNKSCLKITNKIVQKRFNRFIEDADQITDLTPDSDLHRLRIRGKKFRYLLEFFKSFYDAEKINLFLKHMKKVQDNLGDFNDLSVQIDMLHETIDGLSGRNKRTVQQAAALGCLIGVLKQEHVSVRSQFNQTYTSFSTAENKVIMTNLTTPGRTGSSKKDT